MRKGFSNIFNKRSTPSTDKQTHDLPETTLKLIALNCTPLTAICPYFIKLQLNIQRIATEYSSQECHAFLKDLQRVIQEKQHNRILLMQLVAEFEALITNKPIKIPATDHPTRILIGIKY